MVDKGLLALFLFFIRSGRYAIGIKYCRFVQPVDTSKPRLQGIAAAIDGHRLSGHIAATLTRTNPWPTL